jgi:hypothetical protein
MLSPLALGPLHRRRSLKKLWHTGFTVSLTAPCFGVARCFLAVLAYHLGAHCGLSWGLHQRLLAHSRSGFFGRFLCRFGHSGDLHQRSLAPCIGAALLVLRLWSLSVVLRAVALALDSAGFGISTPARTLGHAPLYGTLDIRVSLGLHLELHQHSHTLALTGLNVAAVASIALLRVGLRQCLDLDRRLPWLVSAAQSLGQDHFAGSVMLLGL